MKNLKILLVGCGSISRAWLRTLQQEENVQLVGLVDILPENAIKLAQEFNLSSVKIDKQLAPVLKTTQPDIVFDCTLPEAHVSITLTALRYGCHVLGEKPMADSMQNARKMVAAAQKANKFYAVTQTRRYLHQIQSLTDFLKKGSIGEITTINSDFYLGPHFGGFRDEMEHVLLLDMAIHTFDQARMLAGADPLAVYCKEWNPVHSWYQHGASAIAIFEMTKGIIFTYRGSWCAEGLNTSWEAEWRVVGTNGSASWDGFSRLTAQIPQPGNEFIRKTLDVSIPVRPVNESTKEGHAGVIHEFLDCVRMGKKPQTICTDNIKSLAMVFGAIESAQKGKRIEIRI